MTTSFPNRRSAGRQIRTAGPEALGDPRIEGDRVRHLVSGRPGPGEDIFRRGRFERRRREQPGAALIGELTVVAVAAAERHVEPQPDMQRRIRSEEHTSEIQSLMRISYDVFC